MTLPIENRPASWVGAHGPDQDVVLSSRVRLARNIKGFHFVNKLGEREAREIVGLVRGTLTDCPLIEQSTWIDVDSANEIERQILVERHLISTQHAKANHPRGLAVALPDEPFSVMVNEEDHLRMQVIRPGLDVRTAFEHINRIDDALEDELEFAYSSRFGYVTACPTNVGTGLRISVMLHLPGLRLTGEMEKAQRAAKAMSLAIRGYQGEGSEAVGDFYQLSNQTTLGKSEEELLRRIAIDIIPEVIDYERVARRSLLTKRRIFLEDQVHRALATLRSARLMQADEALRLLSLVRLGVATDLLPGIDLPLVGELAHLVQPGHLQWGVDEPLNQALRRVERAAVIRRALGGA